jgi:NitT/TauT family transport system substrate-binding protein
MDRRRRLKRASLGRVLVVIAVLGTLAGCGGDEPAATEEKAATGGGTEKVELLLSYQRSIAFIGEIMAQEDGYFADEGLEVEPLSTEGGSFVTQQLIAGNKKFGITDAMNLDIAVSKGSPLRSIWEHSRDVILIAAPEDSDVQTVEDLAGKSLGISDPGGGEANFVKAVLEDADVADKVELPAVGAGGPAVLAALESGKIAGYAGFTNDLAGVEAIGMKFRNILPEEHRGLGSTVLTMTQESFDNEADRETAIKIARAWTRGDVAALVDPERALTVACKYVPEECTDMKVARAFMNATLNSIAVREGLKPGEFDHAGLQKEAELLGEKVLGDEPVDFEHVFTNEFADEINSFDEPAYTPGPPKLLEIDG